MFGIDDLISEGLKIVNKFIPDADAAAKAEAEMRLSMLKFESDINTAQAAINQQEAGNVNLFVSGWRPSVGWVCSAAFAWQFVLQPILAFGFSQAGVHQALPVLDSGSLMTVLFGMLGLGGMRSFEKAKGVA